MSAVLCSLISICRHRMVCEVWYDLRRVLWLVWGGQLIASHRLGIFVCRLQHNTAR